MCPCLGVCVSEHAQPQAHPNVHQDQAFLPDQCMLGLVSCVWGFGCPREQALGFSCNVFFLERLFRTALGKPPAGARPRGRKGEERTYENGRDKATMGYRERMCLCFSWPHVFLGLGSGVLGWWCLLVTFLRHLPPPYPATPLGHRPAKPMPYTSSSSPPTHAPKNVPRLHAMRLLILVIPQSLVPPLLPLPHHSRTHHLFTCSW